MNDTTHQGKTEGLSGKPAFMVGLGILLSRLSGLIRELVLAAFLGTRVAADAFKAALQIPGLLQNILGEGTLSASFIPVYSRLVDDEDRKGEADLVAGTIAALLGLLTTVIVLIGILAARPITKALLPVLADETFELTVDLVRIMWAGLGFIVLSSWCLGVLNAHRKFFLSFFAPVFWNAAQVVFSVIAWARDWSDGDIAKAAAWGVLVGGIIQFIIQLPTIRKVAPRLKMSLNVGLTPVREILDKFFPALFGRGVIQLSAFFDLILAGFLATGAFAALSMAQIIYLLPIGLFVMSIISADLPELSRDQGNRLKIQQRLVLSSERIAFYLFFSTFAFLALGKPLVAALFQRGEFTSEDTIYIWLVLSAYSLGLFASGFSRFYQNISYSAGDVKGPAKLAGIRVLVSGSLGFLLMFQFDRLAIDVNHLVKLGSLPSFTPLSEIERSLDTSPQRLGAIGLALGSAIAAWVEYFLLRKRVETKLEMKVDQTSNRRYFLIPAIIAGCVAAAISYLFNGITAYIAAPIALGVSGGLYVLLSASFGSASSKDFLKLFRVDFFRRN
ncbi:MAG: murein biosynthesis integral membrane protein MurJ [Actinomycetota bacterium]|nr:murein biosynthesis integral membrane protein MurJ [Actinomycetota bacterium]